MHNEQHQIVAEVVARASAAAGSKLPSILIAGIESGEHCNP